MNQHLLSRRGFLGGAAAVPAALAATPTGSRSATAKAPDRLVHLLNRISFGIRPGDLERASELGFEDYVEEQLHPEDIDDSETEDAVEESFPTLNYDISSLLGYYETDDRYLPAVELKRATIRRALTSKRQLFEVLVDFWTNHFNIFHFDGPAAYFKTVDDREVIRPHALGNFGDMLMASAKSPAMLFYLDNHVNTVEGPNENYARELLELHTLGVDGGYTQEDVEEVARCFTGWTIARRDNRGSFVFVPFLHDYGAKNVLGKKIKPAGIPEGEEVVELLAAHDSSADLIAYKLCRRFVSDDPPKRIVNRAAKKFRQSGGDIRSIVRTILLSKDFEEAADQKFKRPFEFICSAVRALDAEISADADRLIVYFLRAMGNSPFDWTAPNGYPDEGPAWANSNGMLNRWNIATGLAVNVLPGIKADIDTLVDEADSRKANKIVDFLIDRLLHREMGKGDRKALVDYLSDGQGGTADLSRRLIDRRVPGTIALILDSEYFQLR